MRGNKKAKPQTVAGSLGLAALGVALLIVGHILESHFKLSTAVCGTFGDTSTGCAGSSAGYTAGQVMVVIGWFGVAGGVIGGILLVLGNNAAKLPKPTSGSGSPPATPPATIPVANAMIPRRSPQSAATQLDDPDLAVDVSNDW